ncbi:hypothetical protein CSUI_005252 [Cystoisospora suis]|uniref:Protoheme IX farnesyltransferase, mitochondrial n=1 Tax=Cystoisospora suis TaxID=483139 RepID=A0A2C6KVV8_9APIC|nr:hypothetical protein CSUI_005252 [Cystoisospora suis]
MEAMMYWPCCFHSLCRAERASRQAAATLRLGAMFLSHGERTQSPPACLVALCPRTCTADLAMPSIYRQDSGRSPRLRAGNSLRYGVHHSAPRRQHDAPLATASPASFRVSTRCRSVCKLYRHVFTSTRFTRQLRYSSSQHTPTAGGTWMDPQPSGNSSICIRRQKAEDGSKAAGGHGQRVLLERPSELASSLPAESLRDSYSRRLQRDGAAYWALSKGRLSIWVAISTLAGYAGGLQALSPSCSTLSNYGLVSASASSLASAQNISCVSSSMDIFGTVPTIFLGSSTAEAVLQAAALFAGVFGSSAAANALNQLYERKIDSLMTRTRHRPVASGYLSAPACVGFAGLTALAGVSLLLIHFPSMTAAGLAAFNIALYSGVYTPLKTRSPYSTHVGAVVGAIPLLIGWSAAGWLRLFTGFTLMRAPVAAFRAAVSVAVPPLLHALLATPVGLPTRGLQNVRRERQSSGATDEGAVQAIFGRPSSHSSGMCFSSALGVTTWMYSISSLPSNLFILRSFHRFYTQPDRTTGKHFFLHSLWHIMILLGLAVYHLRPPVPPDKCLLSVDGSSSEAEANALTRPECSRGFANFTPAVAFQHWSATLQRRVAELCPVFRSRRQHGGRPETGRSGSSSAELELSGVSSYRLSDMPDWVECDASEGVDATTLGPSLVQGQSCFTGKEDSAVSENSTVSGGRHKTATGPLTLCGEDFARGRLQPSRSCGHRPPASAGSSGVYAIFGAGNRDRQHDVLFGRVRGVLSALCPHEQAFGLRHGCPVSRAMDILIPRPRRSSECADVASELEGLPSREKGKSH